MSFGLLPVVSTLPRHVTPLAFRKRFTTAEAVAIDLASRPDTEAAAGLRRYLSLVDAAEFVDLALQVPTREGVQSLEAAGLIGVGRAVEILDSPVQTSERP